MITDALLSRFEGHLEITNSCWLWTACKSPKGYGRFQTGTYKNSRLMQSHRFSYTAYKGPIPKGIFVLHTCDVRHCCNPKHLFLGTAKDNSQDMVAKDRHYRGERNCHAKLTDKDIAEIRASNLSSYVIAPLFNVGNSHIRAIRRGENWKHI